MRSLLLFPVVLFAAPAVRGETTLFERGDSNGDGALDIGDALHTLGFLFLGAPTAIGCEDAADANDDRTLDIADPVRALGFLFLGTPPPPSPFGACGRDPTGDALGCETFPPCQRLGERFEEVERYEMDGCQPDSVVLGDLDDDEVLDLVASGWVGMGCGVWARLGNGDGSFGEAFRAPGGTGFTSIALGDFDENGVPDLVKTNTDLGGLSILFGLGDGRFDAGVSYPRMGPFSVAAGDLNGDTHLDLAVASVVAGLSIHIGNGDGTFNEPVGYPLPGGLSVAIGDLNGDGALDVAATTAATATHLGLAIFLGTGDGSFGDAVYYGDVDSDPISLTLGDLNRDGSLDVVVANRQSDDVSIFLGTGDGTFGTAAHCRTGDIPQEVAVGDLDRDGALDIAIASSRDNDVLTLFGKGDGTFVRGASYAVGEGPFAVAIGDVNGDGAADLAVANRESNDVSILIGRP